MTSRSQFAENDLGSLVVRVKGVDLFSGVDGQKLEQQLATLATIIVPVSGSGELTSDTGTYSLRQDHLHICPPGGTFGIQTEQGSELSVYIASFKLLELQEDEHGDCATPNMEQPASLFVRKGDIHVQPAGRAAALCREMARQLGSSDELERLRAQLQGAELVYMLLSTEREGADAETADALQLSKAYIDKHYYEEITIERLATIAGLSSKYFVDLFKKTFGVSAFDYLTQVRMKQAKQLMLRNELKLRDIAFQVGYHDEFYFSRKFKKEFGMPPSAYIKKRSLKIAAYGSSALTGYLLPLGIVPYAAPLHPKWTSYYCEHYGVDIAVHLDAYRHNLHKQANLDKLAGASPDLIISNPELEPWEKEKLKVIAPTFELPDDCLDWRDKLLELAGRLEQREAAELWLANFDHKARKTRKQLRQFGKRRVLVLKLLKDQLYAHNYYSFNSLLYEELELLRAYPREEGCYNVPLGLEELDRIEADCVLLLICKETETLDYWKRLQQSVSWMSLRIIRENRLRLVPSEPWREYSPIALERMLDEAAGLFSGYRP